MILRSPRYRFPQTTTTACIPQNLLQFLLPTSSRTRTADISSIPRHEQQQRTRRQVRQASTSSTERLRPTAPEPTPFCPDVPTFLTLIGRETIKFAPKFPTWDSLFHPNSVQLRKLGIEPARQRRYLLRWRDKFRRGEFGIGGDLKYVVDGVAELRTIEVPRRPRVNNENGSEEKEEEKGEEVVVVRPPVASSSSSSSSSSSGATATTSPGMVKLVVNVPPGKELPDEPLSEVKKAMGFKLHRGGRIRGPHVEYVDGGMWEWARIRVKEGLWEDKRGKKIDGGERRQAQVRAKKRSMERRTA